MAARETRALRQLMDALDGALLRALAEPARAQIVKVLLRDGASEVGAVARHLAQDRSVVSRHLRELEQAGIVRVEKKGRTRVCTLRGDELAQRFEDIAGAIRAASTLCCPPEPLVQLRVPKRRG